MIRQAGIFILCCLFLYYSQLVSTLGNRQKKKVLWKKVLIFLNELICYKKRYVKCSGSSSSFINCPNLMSSLPFMIFWISLSMISRVFSSRFLKFYFNFRSFLGRQLVVLPPMCFFYRSLHLLYDMIFVIVYL